MTTEFMLLFGIGFVAQLVDGALGMAYGVLSNTAILALGLPPAQASALVHTAEVFTIDPERVWRYCVEDAVALALRAR